MTQSGNRTLGVILAGGASSRMGGGDKALLMLDSKPLLGHVLDRLRPQVDHVIISANGDPSRFSAFGVEVVADSDAYRGLGPVAGLEAALSWASRRSDIDRVVTASADSPFFPGDLVTRLVQSPSRTPTVAWSTGQRHPTFSAWHIRALPGIKQALDEGRKSFNALLDGYDAIDVIFEIEAAGGVHIDPFCNINTPQDLAAAERMMTLAGKA